MYRAGSARLHLPTRDWVRPKAAWELSERYGAVSSCLDDASFLAAVQALCVAYDAYTRRRPPGLARSRARAQRRPRERAEVWAAEPGGAHAPRRVAEYTYHRFIWRWAAAWGPTL